MVGTQRIQLAMESESNVGKGSVQKIMHGMYRQINKFIMGDHNAMVTNL
jgi:hypothetical protein